MPPRKPKPRRSKKAKQAGVDWGAHRGLIFGELCGHIATSADRHAELMGTLKAILDLLKVIEARPYYVVHSAPPVTTYGGRGEYPGKSAVDNPFAGPNDNATKAVVQVGGSAGGICTGVTGSPGRQNT